MACIYGPVDLACTSEHVDLACTSKHVDLGYTSENIVYVDLGYTSENIATLYIFQEIVQKYGFDVKKKNLCLLLLSEVQELVCDLAEQRWAMNGENTHSKQYVYGAVSHTSRVSTLCPTSRVDDDDNNL